MGSTSQMGKSTELLHFKQALFSPSVNRTGYYYLYKFWLSSRFSEPHLPFTSSITWFLRNFLNSWIVCCLVTSGPKLLFFLSNSWSQLIASAAVKQFPYFLKCCLCFLRGIPARKYLVTSFHWRREKIKWKLEKHYKMQEKLSRTSWI